MHSVLVLLLSDRRQFAVKQSVLVLLLSDRRQFAIYVRHSMGLIMCATMCMRHLESPETISRDLHGRQWLQMAWSGARRRQQRICVLRLRGIPQTR